MARPVSRGAGEDQLEIIDLALCASIEAAYAGGLDFDDQIYMPVCFGALWPKFPLVLIDEFQDLNELQHAMLDKLVTKRLIGVGDPWQSIYGFRGAVQNGMAAATERWNMREMGLSISFRVPRAGVIRARDRVPHMQWRPDAPEGTIRELAEWDESCIPDGSAIICRNNAPLFTIGLRLLSRGRHIKLIGMDIGAGLVRSLKKLGPPTLDARQMASAIALWQSDALQSAKSAAMVYEKAECLTVLCAERYAGWTLGDAIKYAEDLFKQDGPIQLLSGHKAKGLEWDTVIHLDPWRVPSRFAKLSEEVEQELNIKYVIETRFKQELILVDTRGWQ
jgi:DNA helicase-2/ATP-dependent DNA helicase PcrA